MDLTQISHDVLRILRRRAVPIAIISVLGVIVSAFIAFILPPRYETAARILVESQQIPDQLARSTVTSTAFERLKLIEQRLMARDSVATLIEKLGLYADRPDLSLTEKIEAVRAATSIRSEALGITNPRSGVTISAFTITVNFGDPARAAAIANELVSAVLQQNLRQRSEQARQTLRFFDEERDRLAAEISRLDSEITAFKTENERALPDSVESRRDELARLLDTALEIDRRLLALDEQRGALEAGLADELTPRTLSPEETLLRQLEADLAQKQLRLAPSHPEIQDLIGRIEALRSILSARTGAEEGVPALSARERATRRQIDLIASQIALLDDQRASIAARRAEIETTLQLTPTIETALAGLTRRRDELLNQYESIIVKRADAETGERLEVGQQAERFEVIENALPPEGPVAPSRKKILVLGAGASLGLALGLAFLIEMLNPAIRSSAQFQRQLELAPLAAIPYVRTRRERVRRTASLAFAAIFLLIAMPSGLWAIDRHIRPIQTILDAAIDRSGVDDVLRMIRTRF